MLSNQHFYHRITRKMVVAFGTMFNNIRLIRYDVTGKIEIERITVPLAYADKEKFYKRISVDPELTKEVQILLPRMGFTLDSITYDPLRKTSLYNKEFYAGTNGVKSVQATPYNFDFTLSVYVRNVEDGTQIVEQILPYFNPDYTLSINLTGMPGNKFDLPIILNSVNQNNEANGSSDSTRLITWDLNFTVKGYLYGAIDQSKIITKSTANTFYYNTNNNSKQELILQNGTHNFKIGELVYSGTTLGYSGYTAFVDSWNPKTNTLVVVDSSGNISNGDKLHGAVTRASWDVVSYVTPDYKLSSISVQPDPLTANADDDFGYTTTITSLFDTTTSTSSQTSSGSGGLISQEALQSIQNTRGGQGVQGYDGYQGIQGIQGQSIQGIQGIQGQSIQGIQGIQGTTGVSPGGTTNYLSKFSGTTTINDSKLIQAETTILTQRKAAPPVYSSAATITAAHLCAGLILVSNVGYFNLTLPTGSAIDTELGLSGATPTNVTFDVSFSGINNDDQSNYTNILLNSGVGSYDGQINAGDLGYYYSMPGTSTSTWNSFTLRFYRTGAGTWMTTVVG